MVLTVFQISVNVLYYLVCTSQICGERLGEAVASKVSGESGIEEDKKIIHTLEFRILRYGAPSVDRRRPAMAPNSESQVLTLRGKIRALPETA